MEEEPDVPDNDSAKMDEIIKTIRLGTRMLMHTCPIRALDTILNDKDCCVKGSGGTSGGGQLTARRPLRGPEVRKGHQEKKRSCIPETLNLSTFSCSSTDKNKHKKNL